MTSTSLRSSRSFVSRSLQILLFFFLPIVFRWFNSKSNQYLMRRSLPYLYSLSRIVAYEFIVPKMTKNHPRMAVGLLRPTAVTNLFCFACYCCLCGWKCKWRKRCLRCLIVQYLTLDYNWTKELLKRLCHLPQLH
jgi:hypothetical protein